jgi:hypothetical protein
MFAFLKLKKEELKDKNKKYESSSTTSQNDNIK